MTTGVDDVGRAGGVGDVLDVDDVVTVGFVETVEDVVADHVGVGGAGVAEDGVVG